MFRRPHHQKVGAILAAMNVSFLHETKCYFGGGTAIALLLGEYRESLDIDFLCADQDGYRKLRESVFSNHLGDLFQGMVSLLRDVRADRDGVRTVLAAEDGTPIKFEIVREARIALKASSGAELVVPYLARSDMFAEKLLANADRYLDKAVMSRDVIDLLVMEHHWGPIPDTAWMRSASAYGESVQVAFNAAKTLLRANPTYRANCLQQLGIAADVAAMIDRALTGCPPDHGVGNATLDLG